MSAPVRPRRSVLYVPGSNRRALAKARALPADGLVLDLEDEAGFEAACRQGRDLGFDGKTLIHPRTIEAANRAFAPAPEEVARAARVVAAHAEAEAAGKGLAVVDGRLVEALHVGEARRVLALAEAIAGAGEHPAERDS